MKVILKVILTHGDTINCPISNLHCIGELLRRKIGEIYEGVWSRRLNLVPIDHIQYFCSYDTSLGISYFHGHSYLHIPQVRDIDLTVEWCQSENQAAEVFVIEIVWPQGQAEDVGLRPHSSILSSSRWISGGYEPHLCRP